MNYHIWSGEAYFPEFKTKVDINNALSLILVLFSPHL